MPSLPPECLLVAAHASSLPPPPSVRSATSDASGRPETAESARAPSLLDPPRLHSPPVSLRTPSPSISEPRGAVRSLRPLSSPSPLSLSAVFASVRTRCHSVRLALPLDATAHERVDRWSWRTWRIIEQQRISTNCSENFVPVTHRATRI